MKRILVAFACAAGMLLVLSSSCNDSEGVTSVGGGKGSKGRSGYPQQPFNLGCSPSGGTVTDGLIRREWCCTPQITCGSTEYNPVGGGCFRVSDGIVTISFGIDSESMFSVEFVVAEADVKAAVAAPQELDVGAAVVAGNSVIFRGLETGRSVEVDVFTSSPCGPTHKLNNGQDDTLTIALWTDTDGSGTLTTGDTINVTWSETRAYKLRDSSCDYYRHIISCGTATLIPFSA